MAVALNHVYEEYGQVVTVGNASLRIRATSQCTNIQNKKWTIKYYVQLKAGSTPVSGIVFSGYSKMLSPAWQNTNNYADIPFDRVTGETCLEKKEVTNNASSTGTVETYHYASNRIPFKISRNSQTYYLSVPDIQYGGISYMPPQVDFSVHSTTNSSITIKYNLSSPYATSISVTCNGSTAQAASNITSATNAQYTIGNLRPNTNYTVKVTANCANYKSSSYTKSYVETLPKYVTGLSVDRYLTDGYIVIHAGESKRISPAITPSDATEKNGLIFRTSDKNVFSTEGNLYIKGQNPGTGILTITAGDGSETHTAVSIQVPIKVIKNATGFRILDRFKKIYIQDAYAPPEDPEEEIDYQVGKPYAIRYEISPNDATDRDVVFRINGEYDYVVHGENNVIENGLIYFDPSGNPEYDYSPFNVTGYLQREGESVLEDTFMVIPVSTRSWNDLSLPEYLTTDFCDEVYENIRVIADNIEEKYSVTIDVSNGAKTDNGKETPLYEVSDTLNQIETYIDDIYDAIENVTEDVYLQSAKAEYGSAFSWSGTVQNPIAQVSRWLYFLANVYRHLAPDEEIVVGFAENGTVDVVIQQDSEGNGTIIYSSGGDSENGNE